MKTLGVILILFFSFPAFSLTCQKIKPQELNAVISQIKKPGHHFTVSAKRSDELKIKKIGSIAMKKNEYCLVTYSYRFLVNSLTNVSHITEVILVFDKEMQYLGQLNSYEVDVKIKGASLVFPETQDPECNTDHKIVFTENGPPKSSVVNCNEIVFSD